VRAALATLILSAALAAMLWQLDAIREALMGSKALAAAAIILAGGVIYTAAAFLTGALRVRDIRQALRR
jgi:putative peptidoglycan lipid II flippase